MGEIQNQSGGVLADDFVVSAVLSGDDEIGNADDIKVGETTVSGGLISGEIISLDPGACIVMCSALGQEALVMEALEKGAREYIIKPFKPDHVLASVERALQKSSQG